MSYEDWLSKQSISPISPEAYYAELAWLDGYRKGLALGQIDSFDDACKYAQECVVNLFEYPRFEKPETGDNDI